MLGMQVLCPEITGCVHSWVSMQFLDEQSQIISIVLVVVEI